MMRTAVPASLLVASVATLGALASVGGCTSNVDGDGPPPALPSISEAALSDNAHTAFDYFVSKGLTDIQAAGIVGNLMQESDISPTIEQYGGGPGRGIAQWSAGGRWDTSANDNVTTYASGHGEDRWALATQLDFIWYELTTYGYGYSTLVAATTVSSAVAAFQDKYEICGTCDSSNRVAYAEQALADYGGSTSSGSGSGSGSGAGSGSGSSSGGAECYSGTLGKEMPANSCVQSTYDDLWYQCANGAWIDRWTDPTACSGVYPL